MSRNHAGDTDGFYVTALGTGASALSNERASAGYVVHVDSDPTLVVDAGGGAAGRLSDARIDLTTVDGAFLGHLHIDHTADFPAIVKAAYQQGRGDRPLPVYGPAGTSEYPGTEMWVSQLFDEEAGAYGYLSEFVERYADGELALPVTEVDAIAGQGDDEARIYERDRITVDAIPAVHGQIPSLAYRISHEGASFTFTGDYASETENVPRIAHGTDVLIHNRLLANDVDPDDPKTNLHSTAQACGRNAREARAGTLVLSHVSRGDPADFETALETIREEYDGRVIVLRDLIDIYPDGTVVDARENPQTGRTGSIGVDGPDIVIDDQSGS